MPPDRAPSYPILYTFRRCPYAIRARMALASANLTFEHREVELKDKPESMIQYSPKGTVPVLVTQERVIEESLDIMRWALSKHDPNGLLDIGPSCEVDTAQLIESNDGFFKENLDRYKYSVRFPESPPELYRDKAETFLHTLNTRLEKSRYLFGQTPTFGDIATFPFVRQFANVDLNWFEGSPYSNVRKWLTSYLQSELFIAVMEKSPPWKEGDSPKLFSLKK